MKRSRLKNIISKSKTLSNKQEIGNPFDEFKKSLPIGIDDNYRLEAAWKAYGKPRNFQEAVFYGLVLPIDDATYKLPSIGYDEESDSYEYLNSGKENDLIAKDIRVWDNDVIPFVKELKQGGYIRTFNEEKNCWTYSKQINKETKEDVQQSEIEAFKSGGQMNIIPDGALHAHKNHMELAENGEVTHKGVPVVDNEGNLQAEIEREEWTMSKELTEDVENWYHKFYADDTSEKDKEELAIKCGKRITEELLHNTDDRANLISKLMEEDD